MDFSKIKKISFILLILFIVLFPFWCVRGFCTSSEDVTNTVIPVDNLIISIAQSSFITGDFTSYILPLEEGYTYTVQLTADTDQLRIGYCNEYNPGDEVYLSAVIDKNATLTVNSSEYNYLYFCFGDITSNSYVNYTISRVPDESMSSSVYSLVDNVGIGQIWDIFDISINYIVVVVLFAFGAYIIFHIIRKISKGKEGL